VSEGKDLGATASQSLSVKSVGPQVCSSGLIPVNWPRADPYKAGAMGTSRNGDKTRLSGRPATKLDCGEV
jgi:hypothetical protein